MHRHISLSIFCFTVVNKLFLSVPIQPMIEWSTLHHQQMKIVFSNWWDVLILETFLELNGMNIVCNAREPWSISFMYLTTRLRQTDNPLHSCAYTGISLFWKRKRFISVIKYDILNFIVVIKVHLLCSLCRSSSFWISLLFRSLETKAVR